MMDILVQTQHTKHTMLEDSFTDFKDANLIGSEGVNRSLLAKRKIDLLFFYDDHYYKHYERLYSVTQAEIMDSKWLRKNDYPSREHPAVIPLVCPCQEI